MEKVKSLMEIIKSLIPLLHNPNSPNPFRIFPTEEDKWRSTPIHTATFFGQRKEIIKCLVPFVDNVTNLQFSITTARLFGKDQIATYLTSIINPQ